MPLRTATCELRCARIWRPTSLCIRTYWVDIQQPQPLAFHKLFANTTNLLQRLSRYAPKQYGLVIVLSSP